MDSLCSNMGSSFESFCSMPPAYPSSSFSSVFKEINYSDEESDSRKRAYSTMDSSTSQNSTIETSPKKIRLEDTVPVSPGDLIAAIRSKNLKEVQLQLSGNPKISFNLEQGGPLHIAVHVDEISIAEELLKHKFEIDTEDGMGRTPLHIAADRGLRDMVRFLLNNGANANIHSKHGVAPIHTIVRNANSRPVKANRPWGHIASLTEEQAKLVNEEIFDRNFEVLEALLDCRSVDINVPCTIGKTALYYSVVGANATYAYRLVDLLLRHGADVNVMNIFGRTALSRAMTESRANIIELLLQKGADTNIPVNESRVTPIQWGISRQRGDIIELLLKYSTFNVNSLNVCKDTSVLHYAMASSTSAVLRPLINAGADVRVTNDENVTPFLYCKDNNSPRLEANRRLLLEHLVKLESQKLYRFRKEELQYICDIDHFNLELHYRKLRNEMLALKAMKIPHMSHTFYDLLIASDHFASVLVQNLSVQKYCSPRPLKKLFPGFSRLLNDRYSAGQARIELLRKTNAVANLEKKFFAPTRQTPDLNSQNIISVSTDRIMRFLNNRDLKHLLLAYENVL